VEQPAAGEAAKQLDQASALLRAHAEQKGQEEKVVAAKAAATRDATLKRLEDPAYKPDAKTLQEKDSMHTYTEEDARVIQPQSPETLLAVAAGGILTDTEQVRALNMRAVLLKAEKDREPVSVEPGKPIKGEAVKSGVVVIDDAKQVGINLHIPGGGEEIRLRQPLHIIAVTSKELNIDMTKAAPDRYTGQPVTVETAMRKGKELLPITLEVDKKVEFQFFNEGSADAINRRHHKGLVTDNDGNVAGFQVGENGPLIRLQKGQKLVLVARELTQKRVALDPEGTLLVNMRYPEHRFEITGGMKEKEALNNLDMQFRRQELEKQDELMPPTQLPIRAYTPPVTPATALAKEEAAGKAPGVSLAV
jgi:hypothetical protein